MSVSWDRYCSATESRSRLTRPETFSVVALHAECVRQEPPELDVRHTPKDWPDFPKQGQAHADVLLPDDDLEVQEKLARLAVLVIRHVPKGG
jgi:hypothetical protein